MRATVESHPRQTQDGYIQLPASVPVWSIEGEEPTLRVQVDVSAQGVEVVLDAVHGGVPQLQHVLIANQHVACVFEILIHSPARRYERVEPGGCHQVALGVKVPGVMRCPSNGGMLNHRKGATS